MFFPLSFAKLIVVERFVFFVIPAGTIVSVAHMKKKSTTDRARTKKFPPRAFGHTRDPGH